MCDVAGSLSAAKSLVEQAVAKEAGGDTLNAQELAGQAAQLATHGHDLLKTIQSSEVKSAPTWQALLNAYLHVGQAANALLPEYAGTTELATDELARASGWLESASTALPGSCFAGSSPMD
jgi:hypothetical protein